MVMLFAAIVFLAVVAGVILLARYLRIPLWLRGLVASVWAIVLFFGCFAVLNQWRASDRRSAQIAACEANLRKIDAAIDQYRRQQGHYPATLESLTPLLNKDRNADAILHCPRASVVRDRKQGPDPCGDPPQAPEYDRADCNSLTFLQGDEGPSDYVLRAPAPNAAPSAILVEERDFNHPRGWSPEPQWKTVLCVDGSVKLIHR